MLCVSADVRETSHMKTFAQRSFLSAAALFAITALPATALNLGSLQYRGIGPAISGGRTTAVVGSNLDPQVYYAGGAGGGVFKSLDGGVSWDPIFDKQPVAPIGAIALAPGDPNDVWVGTGESNPRNDVEGGDGIWHSTNGGKTWTHAGLDDAGSISGISVDPRNSKRVVVAVLGHVFRDSTTRGIYITSDGGKTWSRALYVGASSGASDLVRVPDRANTLFAGIYEFRRKPWTMSSGGPNGGVYRSDDGGRTWRKLTGRGLPQGDTGRIGVAAGTRGRVYAVIQAKSGDLWRSDDGGDNWKLMPRNWLVGMRRFYFSRIFVDPKNNDRLINVGLILSESTNGGKSFHKIATNVGWDYHNVWWSADGKRISVGSDEGAILSIDGGKNWRQPYALPFSQPYHIGYDTLEPNYHVCIGLQDNDSWCGWANGPNGVGVLNRDWWTVAPGDGMWALYDPKDPNFIWSTSTASDTGQVYILDTDKQQVLEVSPDARSNGGEPGIDLEHRFNWDTPIAFTADGAALVGGNVIFRSADRGAHWSIISPDLTRNEKSHQQIPGGSIDEDMSGAEMSDTILDIEPSTVQPNVIWVGTDDGLVQLTRDGGATWRNVAPKQMPEWARVSTVDASPYSAGSAFAVGDGHMLGDERPHIFATQDYGATWRSISGDLPDNVFVRVVRQDPKNANLFYAGTQRGVFASWDGGAHWQSLRLNMPATAIYDIQVQPAANDLLVAAHGRGVWVLDDLTVLQQYTPSIASAVTLFAPRDALRWSRFAPINTFPGGLPSSEFFGPNAGYSALLTYSLPKEDKKASIDILDAGARVVRHLDEKAVPHKAGINRTAWDLAENGPVKWHGTFELNQGPATGAEVLPGTYTVRLNANGTHREQRVIVKQDPRDNLTLDEMKARYEFLKELFAQYGIVDTWLNEIDRRVKSGKSSAALQAFKHKLTYDPRNAEDLSGPPGIRERLGDLLGRMGGNYAPPTRPQLDEAAVLRGIFQTLSKESQRVLKP